jgi:uncharacterized membrane protein YhaH (DUF805 family)
MRASPAVVALLTGGLVAAAMALRGLHSSVSAVAGAACAWVNVWGYSLLTRRLRDAACSREASPSAIVPMVGGLAKALGVFLLLYVSLTRGWVTVVPWLLGYFLTLSAVSVVLAKRGVW